MSKADKLRGKLGSFAKEREEFEQKKKALQNEMDKEKQNMGKIKKGIRNNDFRLDPMNEGEDMALAPDGNIPANTSVDAGSIKKTRTFRSNSKYDTDSTPSTANNTPVTTSTKIPIPSGTKISDWCYKADYESAPPVVKTQDLYEDVRFIGRGSFGKVDLIKNKDDNKLYACKSILLDTKSQEHNVLREINLLRRLRHPFIISLHDVFISPNPKKVFLVMHYCESGDLSNVITNAARNKVAITEANIVKWMCQIALSLLYLQEMDVVHRDLKPCNILLADNGDVAQLADFGLAAKTSEIVNKANEEVGTPYYTAPEMINNEAVSFSADHWSFGVLLFELIALKLPFEGDSVPELVKSILYEDYRRNLIPEGMYSPELLQLIDGWLIKNPNERLRLDTALQSQLLISKVLSLPNTYRPKSLEERIRRHNIKQMVSQLDRLGIKQIRQSRNSVSPAQYEADDPEVLPPFSLSLGFAHSNSTITASISSDESCVISPLLPQAPSGGKSSQGQSLLSGRTLHTPSNSVEETKSDEGESESDIQCKIDITAKLRLKALDSLALSDEEEEDVVEYTEAQSLSELDYGTKDTVSNFDQMGAFEDVVVIKESKELLTPTHQSQKDEVNLPKALLAKDEQMKNYLRKHQLLKEGEDATSDGHVKNTNGGKISPRPQERADEISKGNFNHTAGLDPALIGNFAEVKKRRGSNSSGNLLLAPLPPLQGSKSQRSSPTKLDMLDNSTVNDALHLHNTEQSGLTPSASHHSLSRPSSTGSTTNLNNGNGIRSPSPRVKLSSINI